MNHSERIIAYLGEHFSAIEKDARLIGNEYHWGARFQTGDTVSKGTMVVYIDKVFVALRETSEVPYETHPDWGFLVALHKMRVTDAMQDDWFNFQFPVIARSSPEAAMSSAILIRYLQRKLRYVLRKPIEGMHKWRGLFRWGLEYSPTEIVAYQHGVYLATPGNGVPGHSDGWSMLDFVDTSSPFAWDGLFADTIDYTADTTLITADSSGRP